MTCQIRRLRRRPVKAQSGADREVRTLETGTAASPDGCRSWFWKWSSRKQQATVARYAELAVPPSWKGTSRVGQHSVPLALGHDYQRAERAVGSSGSLLRRRSDNSVRCYSWGSSLTRTTHGGLQLERFLGWRPPPRIEWHLRSMFYGGASAAAHNAPPEAGPKSVLGCYQLDCWVFASESP